MKAGPSGSSGPSTRSKKRKNTCTNDDSQACSSILDAHDKGDLCPWVLEIKHYTYKFLSEKIFDQVGVNPDIPVKAVQDQLQRDLEVQISMSKAFKAKAKAKREIRGDHGVSENIRLFRSINLGFRACRRDLLGLDGAFMKGPFPGQYLGDDIDVHPNSNFTFISDRQKGIIPATKTVFLSVEHRYCLRHIHENIKQGWCGQAYKDLLWRSASATSVKEFEKCMRELKKMNPKAHEWLNKIPPEHWARSYFLEPKSDLLLNNICEVFNGKIVRGRDKPVITLLEYIREYCMKRIVNVQSVIDKCTGPLTPTATRIMESIKKEAHFMKVQWNGANKYKVLGIPCKHVVAACWNMALNDRAAPPPEAWVNPCYWLTTCRETYSHKVGRPKKKRKRSKHEEELFVKNGKLSKKRRTITCQSCENIRHNKATCKGQGGNNAIANGSASRQAQQAKLVVSQDGSGGSGVGAVIGLSVVDGAGGAGGTCVGVGSQASNWLERLPAGSITTWEDLTNHLFAQFFPPGRTVKLRNDILMFQQHHGESLSKAWTRFKDLLQKVPHHGIDLWLEV
ncbi:crooked neck-like protein 1 [Tanacetum coccineum]